jgi:hypothetical protein
VKGKRKKSCPCAFFINKHHATKAYWGNRGIAPRILDLGATWRWVISFTPSPFYNQVKSPCYPLDRRLGGPQSRSGHSGEKFPVPAGTRTPDLPALSPALCRWAIPALKMCEKNWIKIMFGHMRDEEQDDVESYVAKNLLLFILCLLSLGWVNWWFRDKQDLKNGRRTELLSQNISWNKHGRNPLAETWKDNIKNVSWENGLCECVFDSSNSWTDRLVFFVMFHKGELIK